MKSLFLIISFFTSLSSFSAVYLKVLYIADHYTDCGNQKCLLSRDTPTDSFTVFYPTITGFKYEEGYEYCLLIEIQTTGVAEPANTEDSSAIRYVLSEVKSKIKTAKNKSDYTPESTTVISDSTKWMLYKLRMKDGSTKTFTVQKAFLQFNKNNSTFNAFSDCNGISGEFSIKGDTIQFDNITSTLLSCGKRSIEKDFISAIKSATIVKITPKMLYLKKGKTLLGLFTKTKPEKPSKK